MTEKKFQSKLSNNVSFTGYHPDAIWYSVIPDCGCTDCTMKMEMELSDAGLMLNFYKKVGYYAYIWYQDNLWDRIKEHLNAYKRRIVGALTLIFTGSIEMEETFIVCGEGQIDDMITALQEAKEYLEEVHKN